MLPKEISYHKYSMKIINMFYKFLEKNKLRLAPMAGVTNSPFREICLLNHSGFVTTEEIDATSLVYNKSNRTKEIADFYAREKPIAMQLLGCDKNIMVEASMILQEKGADIIDINMGCPVPKITKKGKGAALMKNISQTAKLVNRIRKVTKIPLTAKIRSGWNEENENAVEFSKMLEEEGIDAITIHPRTRFQRYQGTAKWEIIKKVVENVKVPITGNGDINSFNDAESMIKFTKCNSVMIGRAAIGNPWIFNPKYQKSSINEKLSIITSDVSKHIEFMKDFFSYRNVDLNIKKQLAYYSKGFKNSKELRQRIFRTNEKIDVIFDFFIENLNKNFQTTESNFEKTSV